MRMKYYKQRDSMDCGPACLAMICSLFQRKINVNTIRELTCLNKEGVSLLGISKAAEAIGLRSIGGRVTLENLHEKKILPAIIHWDQNHFVVLYKIKKKKNQLKLYVADPNKGLIVYNESDFTEHWISTKTDNENKGIVLYIQPTEKFYTPDNEKSSNNHSLFLIKHFKKYKWYFLQIIIGTIFGALLQLIFPFLTQSIVDIGIKDRDIDFIWLVLMAQLMLLISRTAVDFIRNKTLLHISARINISLVSDFFIKLMNLPMSFFDTKLMGDLLQRIEDHRRVEQFLTSNSLNLIFSFFSFIIFGAVLFYYNLKIFITFIAFSVVYCIWMSLFLKRRRRLDIDTFELSAQNRSVTYQLIRGMEEIKLQGCQQKKRWEWEDVQALLFDINLKSLNLQQVQEAGNISINEIKNILITFLAATAVINGQMSIGMMLSVQYIIGQLNAPIDQLVKFIYHWQDVTIGLDRMNEIHQERSEENENRLLTSVSNKNIQIRNLYFKYDRVAPYYTLENINLILPQGKTTAIVGASGSGKTTLLKLLLGYYEPIEGQITIGDTELKNVNLVWWRNNCGAVMQEGYVFSDTIANNIAISDNEPNFQRIRNAAKEANVSEYIENLPLAYNTVIGLDGQGLSQGQKQRLLISRVIYKNPDFVLFDEATNALDTKNEKIIMENLEKFYVDKTVVVVAHRLSTVKNADNIVVLDKGKIVETGTHIELIKSQGFYYELVRNQLELGG